MITEPGIYDIAAAAYHADPCPEPSLSSSIAKVLCLSSAAHAWQDHPRLNPTPTEDNAEHFDIGTAAHALLLEGSTAIAVVDAPDWRTKLAKEARAAAYAAGQTPLLAHTWTAVQAMADAARAQLARHTDGGAAMFTMGASERTIVWKEDDVWCRARLDYLRSTLAGPSIDDYKTTGVSAEPDEWCRKLFYDGRDIQPAWYLRGLRAITGEEGTFRFCVQETYPPYALSVIALGPAALMLAEKKCLYALELWRESRQRNEWIGYPRRTCYAALPMAHESWWLEKETR
jgi:hypothetical protein